MYVNLGKNKEKNLNIKQDKSSLNDLEKFAKLNNVFISRRIMLYYDLQALIFLYKEFKNKKFDAIHSFTSKAGFDSYVAGYFAKINIRLHTFTGQVWFTKKGLLYIFLKSCDRLISDYQLIAMLIV